MCEVSSKSVHTSYELSIKDRTSSPTFLSVELEDNKTGKRINLIVDNTLFSGFIMSYLKLSFEGYITFMIKNKDVSIKISFDKFNTYLLSKFGSINSANKYLRDNSYNKAYSLDKFGSKNIYQLLDKYFYFKEKYKKGFFNYEKKNINPDEPEFIAMLINCGCIVKKGDVTPFLMVSCAKNKSNTGQSGLKGKQETVIKK